MNSDDELSRERLILRHIMKLTVILSHWEAALDDRPGNPGVQALERSEVISVVTRQLQNLIDEYASTRRDIEERRRAALERYRARGG